MTVLFKMKLSRVAVNTADHLALTQTSPTHTDISQVSNNQLLQQALRGFYSIFFSLYHFVLRFLHLLDCNNAYLKHVYNKRARSRLQKGYYRHKTTKQFTNKKKSKKQKRATNSENRHHRQSGYL